MDKCESAADMAACLQEKLRRINGTLDDTLARVVGDRPADPVTGCKADGLNGELGACIDFASTAELLAMRLSRAIGGEGCTEADCCGPQMACEEPQKAARKRRKR